MAFLEISNVALRGVACAVPRQEKVVREQPFFTEAEARNFTAVTGVERSRVAPPGMTCSDLCMSAAERLLDAAGWERDSIDLLVFVSSTRDFYIYPNTANILQDRLGLQEECIAIDLPFACSGYVYGLSVAASILSAGKVRRALLLAGEATSKIQSSRDKTVWPLHGDAGSATLLEYAEGSARPMQFHLQGDGSGHEAIICRECGSRHPMTENSFAMEKIEDGIVRAAWQTAMDGMSVFSFAITKPYECIKELCEHFSFSVQDVDYLIIHQANKMIDEKIRGKLHLSEAQVPYSMMRFGNTSSCTIPVTMVSQLREELQSGSRELLMCGFGSGLSWGACRAFTDGIICPDIVEV